LDAGLATLAAAVVAGVFGLFRVAATQREANRRPYLTAQLQACIEITDHVATLVTDSDPLAWEMSRRAFWRLYWGSLCLFENREMEDMMIKLGELIPQDPVPDNAIPMTHIRSEAYSLAHVARKMLLKNWRIHSSGLGLKPSNELLPHEVRSKEV
jgi:hypothetical protein